MDNNIWQQIKKIVDSGKCPEITLLSEQEVKQVKARPGRPWNLPEERNFTHYLGKALSPHLGRPACHRKGCKAFLKRDQPVACSDYCAQQLIMEAEMILTILKRKKMRFPKVISRD